VTYEPKSRTAYDESCFEMTVSPLTVNGCVALTRSPACKFEIALFNSLALETETVRVGEKAGRVCV
jgi:hypothetical protein